MKVIFWKIEKFSKIEKIENLKSQNPKSLLRFLDSDFRKIDFRKKMCSTKIFWNRLKRPFLALLFACFGPKKSTFPKNFFFRKFSKKCTFFSAVFGLCSAQFKCIWALIRRIWEPLVYLGSLGAEVVRFRKKKYKNFRFFGKFFIFFFVFHHFRSIFEELGFFWRQNRVPRGFSL